MVMLNKYLNNKLEKAAMQYADENSIYIDDDTMGDIYVMEKLSDAYKAGAKYVINEFLKDLWHPVSKQPNIEGKPILFNCIDHDCIPSWCVYPIGFNGNWKIFCISHGITKWLYIDDLLLK